MSKELAFDDYIVESLLGIRELINKSKAGLIIIDGASGEGKTTLAIHISEFYDKNFNWENQIGMGGGAFMKCADWASKNNGKVVIYDEAGDFNKRGALTEFNKMINRFFETYRVFRIIPIICIPRFWVIENHLFDLGIPQMLINCYDRRDSYGRYRVYDLRSMYYLKANVSKMVFKPSCYSSVTPVLYGTFRNLPRDKAIKLERLSKTTKHEITENAYAKVQGLLTTSDVVRALGLSYTRTVTLLAEVGVNAVEMIGNKKYYEKSVISNLVRDRQVSKKPFPPNGKV